MPALIEPGDTGAVKPAAALPPEPFPLPNEIIREPEEPIVPVEDPAEPFVEPQVPLPAPDVLPPPAPLPPEPEDPAFKAMADMAAQTLRTAFPAAWAYLATWLITKIPAADKVFNGPAGALIQGVVLSALVALLYFLFRKLEKQTWVPKVIVLFILGNIKQPLSVARPVANAVRNGAVVPLTGLQKAA